MLIEHQHAIVGRALKDMRRRIRRESRVIALLEIRVYTTAELARALKLPERTARRIVADLLARRLLERAGEGYRKKRAA